MCDDALEGEPECVPLLVMRARAHIALRRDLEAQSDLRDIIRLDPQCSVAYRLLGELAARRDENESAAIFFREALRLAPDDNEASDWLQIVESSSRPAAVAQKLPAPAAAAGRFPRASLPSRGSSPRFAKGTHPPAEERCTEPYRGGRASSPLFLDDDDDLEVEDPIIPLTVEKAEKKPAIEKPTVHGSGVKPRLASRPMSRGP